MTYGEVHEKPAGARSERSERNARRTAKDLKFRCTCHRRCNWRSFSVLRASRSLSLARRSGSFRMTICSMFDFFTASAAGAARPKDLEIRCPCHRRCNWRSFAVLRSTSLATLALLGMSFSELKNEIAEGTIVAVSTGIGMRVAKEEMIATAMRTWPRAVIEEALGHDASRLLPEAIRLVELRPGCGGIRGRCCNCRRGGVRPPSAQCVGARWGGLPAPQSRGW